MQGKNIFYLSMVVFFLFYSDSIAGPFGLSMGMTKSQCESVCKLEEIKPYMYITKEVPKPHSDFEKYVLRITPTLGLYYLKAIGNDISTTVFGDEVKIKFNKLKELLKNVYGDHRLVDRLRSGSIWDEPKEWMIGLRKGDRALFASWGSEYNSQLKKENINKIILIAGSISNGLGYISLEYYFSNYKAAAKEIKKKKQTVF